MASDEERRKRAVRVDYRSLHEGRGAYSSLRIPPESPVIERAESGEKDGGRLTKEGLDGSFSEDTLAEGVSRIEARHHKGVTSESEGLSDADRLRLQLAKLEDEEGELLAQKEVAELQRQVDDKQRSVSRLRGEVIDFSSKSKKPSSKSKVSSAKSKGSSSKKSGASSKTIDLDTITLKELRDDKSLRKQAEKLMVESGFVFGSDSEESELSNDSDSHLESSSVTSKSVSSKKVRADSDSEFESDSGKQTKKKNKKKKKKSKKARSSASSDSSSDEKSKKKSGILSKSSDRVKFRQNYPQAFLRFEHVSSKIGFENLDFSLFVAGELEIISNSSTGTTEKQGRLEFLKRLMYLSSTYDFLQIRGFYAAVLREIELGNKDWEDDFSSFESSFFRGFKRSEVKFGKPRSDESFGKVVDRGSESRRIGAGYIKPKVEEDKEEKAWFCSPFQRNKCEHKMAHSVVYKGKMRWALHICATCYQREQVKRSHPECASDCPHSGSKQ